MIRVSGLQLLANDVAPTIGIGETFAVRSNARQCRAGRGHYRRVLRYLISKKSGRSGGCPSGGVRG
jgi:hypothetical protein